MLQHNTHIVLRNEVILDLVVELSIKLKQTVWFNHNKLVDGYLPRFDTFLYKGIVNANVYLSLDANIVDVILLVWRVDVYKHK